MRPAANPSNAAAIPPAAAAPAAGHLRQGDDGGSPAAGAARGQALDVGSRLAPHNWRVRTRLIALIVVPTAVAVLLGSLRVFTSVSSATEYGRAEVAAQFVGLLGDLSHELQYERDLSARFVAAGRRSDDEAQVTEQRLVVDTAVTRMKYQSGLIGDALSDSARGKLSHVTGRLEGLVSLRAVVSKSRMPPLPVIEKYSFTLEDIIGLYDEMVQGSGDESFTATRAALTALARAKEEGSKQRGILAVGITAGRLDPAENEAYNQARSRQSSALDTFLVTASAEQRQLYSDTVTGQRIDRAAFLAMRATVLQDQGLSLKELAPGDDLSRWFEAMNETLTRMHKVERDLSDSLALHSRDVRASDTSLALVNASVVAGLLVLVLVITLFMARSLVLPLRRLRSEALEVAEIRLPTVVEKLREASPGTEPPQVQPMRVVSADEIGEVARAFDEVHREAVRLAGEESRLRGNINAMFVNLSRRTQTLVERQISLIDGLEQGEGDEKRLDDLFKLDHLATRMRRNSENLLVLAGQEPPRRWSRPVELVDVVRASLSEVENYERVNIRVPSGITVSGLAVNDVIHLLAELVENAISFSPRETRVIVAANRIDGGAVMLLITDSGIGMTGDELTNANWRLSNPPNVDVSVSRRMGLFVVSKLARRHHIRVQLRPHDTGGLTAMVLLPDALTGVGTQAMFGAGYGLPASADSGLSELQSAPSHGPKDAGGSWNPELTPAGGTPWPPRAGQSKDWNFAVESLLPAPVPAVAEPQETVDRWYDDRGGFPPPPVDHLEHVVRPDPASDTFPPHLPIGGFVDQEAATGPLPPLPPDPAFGPPQHSSPVRELPHLPSSRLSNPGREEEFLPIFASIESAWFRQTRTDDDQPESDKPPQDWDAVASDPGWNAAEVVNAPVNEGSTASGLPKRVPKANLVPGAAEPLSEQKTPKPEPASPERMRSRLAEYQQGIKAARADIGDGKVRLPGPSGEEQADDDSSADPPAEEGTE
ncbi:sensor histidine kinase [Sinosporangium siamense]|uniref:histidine kinase n=1 Tax=Sinosporangium siamense TaxID=1367973 RepID=A0A919RGJ8_9ACTN|nr:nitrate- and nitrite sensing domain-containing protein [Sinosporangium siamense]GII91419.1 hypothetical protein Ssi02_16500 [Sinosporangium siamense]